MTNRLSKFMGFVMVLFTFNLLFISKPAFAQEAQMILSTGHGAALNSVAFSPNGEYVVTSSDIGEWIVWHAAEGIELFRVGEEGSTILSVDFIESKNYIAARDSFSISVWDINSGQLVSTFIQKVESFNSLDSSYNMVNEEIRGYIIQNQKLISYSRYAVFQWDLNDMRLDTMYDFWGNTDEIGVDVKNGKILVLVKSKSKSELSLFSIKSKMLISDFTVVDTIGSAEEVGNRLSLTEDHIKANYSIKIEQAFLLEDEAKFYVEYILVSKESNIETRVASIAEIDPHIKNSEDTKLAYVISNYPFYQIQFDNAIVRTSKNDFIKTSKVNDAEGVHTVIQRWDLTTLNIVAEVGDTSDFYNSISTNEDQTLICQSWRGLKTYDLDNLEIIATKKSTKRLNLFKYSLDKKHFVVAKYNGLSSDSILVLNSQNLRLAYGISVPRKLNKMGYIEIEGVAINGAHSLLYFQNEDRYAILVDTNNLDNPTLLRGRIEQSVTQQRSETGKYIAVYTSNGTVKLLDGVSKRILKFWKNGDDGFSDYLNPWNILNIAFSNDEDYLFFSDGKFLVEYHIKTDFFRSVPLGAKNVAKRNHIEQYNWDVKGIETRGWAIRTYNECVLIIPNQNKLVSWSEENYKGYIFTIDSGTILDTFNIPKSVKGYSSISGGYIHPDFYLAMSKKDKCYSKFYEAFNNKIPENICAFLGKNNSLFISSEGLTGIFELGSCNWLSYRNDSRLEDKISNLQKLPWGYVKWKNVWISNDFKFMAIHNHMSVKVVNLNDVTDSTLIINEPLAIFAEIDSYNGTISLGLSTGLISVYSLSKGNYLYTTIYLENDNWLNYDKESRYDGSEVARENIYLTCGSEILELDQFKDALFVPGLSEKKLSNSKINYPKLSDLEICGALPVIEQDAKFSYRIKPRSLGLKRVEVYINDRRTFIVPIKKMKMDKGDYILNLDEQKMKSFYIPGQENLVRVIGIVDRNGAELRSRGVVIEDIEVIKDTVQPSLFAVMIGISDYKDDQLDLNYPVIDAVKLGEAIEKSAKNLLGEENVHLYNVNSDFNSIQTYTTPEREGIKNVFQDIGRRAEPQDMVLIFFAGHGVMQGTESKKFTLLTAEASKYNEIGISTDDLLQWLSPDGPNKLKANKSILILDACNSGQAAQELVAMLARDDDETQRIRQVEELKDKSGTFILTASAPNQSAYEVPQFGQGLLTYCLLKTLKQNPAILDDEKYLNVQKWFLESEKELQEITKELGIDQDAQPIGTTNIRIGLVDTSVTELIQLASLKPLVICANAINVNLGFDNLTMKKIFNNELLNSQEYKVSLAKGEIDRVFQINIIYEESEGSIAATCKVIQNGQLRFSFKHTGSVSNIETFVVGVIKNIERNID